MADTQSRRQNEHNIQESVFWWHARTDIVNAYLFSEWAANCKGSSGKSLGHDGRGTGRHCSNRSSQHDCSVDYYLFLCSCVFMMRRRMTGDVRGDVKTSWLLFSFFYFLDSRFDTRKDFANPVWILIFGFEIFYKILLWCLCIEHEQLWFPTYFYGKSESKS